MAEHRKSNESFVIVAESRPLPPPKPQLPKEKEEEIPPAAAISSINSNSNATSKIQHRPKLNVKMERAKTFVGSNVHKTSLKSDRILPNDDLVLNQARRQKSFAASNSGPAAKKINQLKNSAENKVNLQRASSMGHLEKPEEKIVRVRSLVEVDDYDGKVFFLTSNHLNFCPILSLYVQSVVLAQKFK